MTATTINTRTTPSADAIQEALAFLRNLSKKNSAESGEKTESVFNSDVFKTIEAALKNSAEAKAVSENGEDASEDEDETVHKEKQTAFTASQDTDEDDEEDADTEDDETEDDGEEEEEDNEFAGEYYWNPGPEWKTIGLVAGGAALVGLGALLCKLFDD